MFDPIPSRRSHGAYAALAVMAALMPSGCVHVAPLRVCPDDVPAGASRLLQVMRVGARDDVVSVKEWHQARVASGLRDEDIVDGSLAVGRIDCCGGPADLPRRQDFGAPRGVKVHPLDTVEVPAGRQPAPDVTPVVNTVTRVVQTANAPVGACGWDPPDPRPARIQAAGPGRRIASASSRQARGSSTSARCPTPSIT